MYFDRVGPMTYPSHYNKNFIGLDSADNHPYEVTKYTMKSINKKISDLNSEILLAKWKIEKLN
ncbi:hypothetical protein LDC_2779 [sediment metagenome]|uniref:DUF4015 domain-containing protein n=1 Tax=sediment metagenome TaxID=749907 RepID=D9PMK1_9ZZZZ